MGELSVIQIVMVLVVALLVFGPARLPELAKQLGKGLRDLRKHATSVGADLQRAVDDDAPAPAPRAASPAAPTAASSDDDAALLAGVVVSDQLGAGDRPAARATVDADRPIDDLLEGVVVSGDTPAHEAPSNS